MRGQTPHIHNITISSTRQSLLRTLFDFVSDVSSLDLETIMMSICFMNQPNIPELSSLDASLGAVIGNNGISYCQERYLAAGFGNVTGRSHSFSCRKD